MNGYPPGVMAYEHLCRTLLRFVLSKDGWSTLNPHGAPRSPNRHRHEPAGAAVDSIFRQSLLVAHKEGRRILFCLDTQSPRLTQRIAREVARHDGGKFHLLCVLVVRSASDMERLRRVERARHWPRVFFVAFKDLCRKAAQIDVETYRHLLTPPTPPPRRASDNPESSVGHLPAEVIANVPVGGPRGPHFKLRVRATGMQSVVPGQFIMLNTHPRQTALPNRIIDWGQRASKIQLTPTSFLKRPFGIHRAFYPHFDRDYLKHLALPPILSTILHTVHPHQFDIFYKVLEHGIGTREMSRLKRGDRVELLAPLGQRFDIRGIRNQGIEEIHVIGGGVGMTPLIFMIQALRFHGHQVRVFLGVESIAALRYADDLSSTYGEDAAQAHVYVDDLLEIGLKREDVFLATEKDRLTDVLHVLPRSNLYRGLVSEHYRRWLKTRPSTRRMAREGKVMAFTCGPTPMMKAIHQITGPHRIPLRVLMEKRMACGIGVCFSCVCRCRATGQTERYARVCMDGPIFDAEEILWD